MMKMTTLLLYVFLFHKKLLGVLLGKVVQLLMKLGRELELMFASQRVRGLSVLMPMMNFLVDTSAEVFIGQTIDLKEQQKYS